MLLGGTLAILLILAILFWLIFYFYRNRTKMIFEQERKEVNARLEEREIMMSQISKEVHDNIGQISTMVMMHLRKIKKMSASPEQLRVIQWAMDYAGQLINNAHHISYSLNSDYITQQGLYNVIGQQLDRIKKVSNIDTVLNINEDGGQLLPEHALVIYRIVQEAVSNIVKHAEASLIEINILFHNNLFRMTISDNGVGFDVGEACKGGLGIGHMTQRAKLLGGDLIIRSRPGLGCEIALSIKHLLCSAK